MISLTTPEEIQVFSKEERNAGKRVALVPTLGALHEGHRVQIETAREHADCVVVSLFLDPEEFGTNEDFHQYPRDLEADRAFCEAVGVDALFHPETEQIHPQNEHSTYVEEQRVAAGLCGISRSHHFRGVATTFLKLYHLITPDMVVLSEHPVQRFAVIRRVVRDLFIPAVVISAPLVRESDGLVADARNTYLNPSQRREAGQIYQALHAAKHIVEQGNTSVDRISAEVINQLRVNRRLHVLYAHIVDREHLGMVREITPGHTLICVGVLIDQVRLVDHIPL